MKKNKFEEHEEKLIDEAIHLKNEEKYDEAVAVLLSIYEDNVDSKIVNGLLGGIYHLKQQWDRALFYFERTIRLNPNSELASVGLFNSYWKTGRFKKALKEMDRFLKSNEPDIYKTTIEELFENIDDKTPEYTSRIVKFYYSKYII